MLRFSDTNSLGFAGEVEYSSNDQLVCYGPLQSETLSSKSDLIFVPGTSEEHSTRVLQEISNQVSSSLSSSYYLSSGISGELLTIPHKVRLDYINRLKSAHQAWIDDGKKITPKVAENLIALRKIIRQSTRAQDPIPSFGYKFVDRVRGEKIAKGQSYQRLFKQGNYRAAIEKSFTPGETTKKTLVSSRLGKLLRRGSAVVMVADISTSAARVYFAANEEEQQKSGEALGDDLGASLGVVGGAKLCAALTVTTAGIGLLGCGIALGAGFYLGGRTGSMIVGGQTANDLVNSIRDAF